MSTGSPTPHHIRQAAIDDYTNSGDSYATVAARHGISRSILHAWVNPEGVKKRGPRTWADHEVAYRGGWEVRGGILRPLLPERRTA